MSSQFQTLVVAAITCTLVGLIVTYTVGQSGVESRSGDAAAHKWKSDDEGPLEIGQADEPTEEGMSPMASAAFWSQDMGDQPRDLSGGQVVASETSSNDRANVERMNASMSGVNSARPLSQQASEFLTTMQQLEARLQTLGASYYRLESSEDGQTFRFHCEMPLSEQPGFHRFFEAEANSPEDSMERVIDAVEQWLAVRMPN